MPAVGMTLKVTCPPGGGFFFEKLLNGGGIVHFLSTVDRCQAAKKNQQKNPSHGVYFLFLKDVFSKNTRRK
ncbi:MAG: hypothetical protein Q8K92_23945 [Leadbetterella sp.]|nr:hypothetical protein [Leadbetterella sp.]